MPDISSTNLITAFGIALAAGLFTVLGSGLVMFSKTPNPRVLSFGLAFAGGAMVYVSLTEIFNKSSEAFGQVYDKDKAFAAATLAFLAGMGAIALIDRIVPNPHETLDPHDPAFQENKRRHIARVGMMAAFAITAHNFPEGLATFFATLENPAVGMPLALAIAIHNIYSRRYFHCRPRLFCHPQPQKNRPRLPRFRACRTFGRGFGLHPAQAVFIAFRVRCGVRRDCGRDGVPRAG